jgi:hypothetical protein
VHAPHLDALSISGSISTRVDPASDELAAGLDGKVVTGQFGQALYKAFQDCCRLPSSGSGGRRQAAPLVHTMTLPQFTALLENLSLMTPAGGSATLAVVCGAPSSQCYQI